jgi:hypothetical protein
LELPQTLDISPCPNRHKDGVLEHKTNSGPSAAGLGLPRSQGSQAGRISNEKRPIVSRMGEEEDLSRGISLEHVDIFCDVAGKVCAVLRKRT